MLQRRGGLTRERKNHRARRTALRAFACDPLSQLVQIVGRQVWAVETPFPPRSESLLTEMLGAPAQFLILEASFLTEGEHHLTP